MIAATGYRSSIVRELASMSEMPIVRLSADLHKVDCLLDIPWSKYFVLAAGVLHQKQTLSQSPSEIEESLAVNLVNVIRICETIFKYRENAVICVVGSYSGIKGSYDQTYAAAKAGVHQYVQCRQTVCGQRIFAVAPHIILDSGMTERRKDYADIQGRPGILSARDVAKEIYRGLFMSEINNEVVVLR